MSDPGHVNKQEIKRAEESARRAAQSSLMHVADLVGDDIRALNRRDVDGLIGHDAANVEALRSAFEQALRDAEAHARAYAIAAEAGL